MANSGNTSSENTIASKVNFDAGRGVVITLNDTPFLTYHSSTTFCIWLF